MDPELARYLNRNYWQKRSEDTAKTATTMPSAPSVTSAPQNSVGKTSEVKKEEKEMCLCMSECMWVETMTLLVLLIAGRLLCVASVSDANPGNMHIPPWPGIN